VSAHVVPKVPAFSTEDEDEKTTIESGWEEEASTTVEQGDIADKIRALGVEPPRRPNTNITSTTGSSMSDEPTADDQRGAAALAMLPPPVIARLVITQGNDAGQAIEVRPGKTYTIGRGIDNDLVLTDIAVSRKHFDIRHERGAWVLADRGSGNGTLVNRRIEDAPFPLASGDVIEIGNTSFRFDVPNGVPRTQSSYDVAVDDDLELSTVAGKPLPETEAATPHVMPPMAAPLRSPGMSPVRAPGLAPLLASAPVTVPLGPAVARPKTLPPPQPAPPPRPRTPSNRPPAGYALDRPGPQSASQPQLLSSPSLAASMAPTMSPMHGMQAASPPSLVASLAPLPGMQAASPMQHLATTLPLPQMANRPPLAMAALLNLPGNPQNASPATIPGQGAPMQSPHPARLPFAYPTAAGLPQSHAQNGPHGQPVIVASGQPGRDATSTALVQPISYTNGQPAAVVPQQPYNPPPQLSRRMKLVLGGAGLALVAAVTTIAIINGSSGAPSTGPTTAPAPRAAPPPRPTVEPIRDPKAARPVAPTSPRADKERAIPPTAPPPVAPKLDKVTTTTTTSPTSPTSPTTSPVAPKLDKVTTTTTTAPPTTPTTPTTTTTTTTPVAPKPDKIATAPTPLAPTTTPPVTTPPVTPKVEVAPATPKTDKPPRTDVAALSPTRNPKRADKRTDKRTDKKASPAVTRVEPDRNPKVEVAPATPKTDKKRGGRSTQDVKNDADGLYRAKRFGEAAALVTSSLSGFSGSDSQELKSIAAIYSQLGKAYNVGMAPGTKATDAFVALRRASSYDRSVGSAYVSEIEKTLVTVASKAAMSYAASKEYEAAFQAVRISESLGSTSPTNASIRSKLEDLAADMYRSAQGELASDPDSAKQKLRQVLVMVDTKSPLYSKASKLLNGS
jgi:Inner membrane component of T3SS, cytoplasmic domain